MQVLLQVDFELLNHADHCNTSLSLAKGHHFKYVPPSFPGRDRDSPSAGTCAPVAQLDRVLDYESRGREFESLRARQLFQ